ncbi:MAG: DUF1214 domain-containing protein [Pannonibacter phragmitetus]
MNARFEAGPDLNWKELETPAVLSRRKPHPLWRAFTITLLFAGALIIGVGSAYLALSREDLFQSVRIGVWGAHPLAGTPEADPYSAAIFARLGRVPLASGEGVAFIARETSAGRPLRPGCTYMISGLTPSARLWTLTSADGEARLVPVPMDRLYLDSNQILRKPDGSFDITASARPAPGNWLPTGKGPGLSFILRLYDAPITTGSSLAGLTMPAITEVSCP